MNSHSVYTVGEMMTLVSAIITTYHRDAAMVERALKSILNQTYPVGEILIIDDNEDGNPFSHPVQEMCRRYPKVQYVNPGGNHGACASRNIGIHIARGKYIGCLDDDDQWMPDKIEKQMEVFETGDEDLGLVYCSGIAVNDETGEEVPYYNYGLTKDITFEDLLAFDCIGSTSNPLVKKQCYEEVGGFWEKQPARQDYEMWLRIAKKFKVTGISGKHFIYALHPGDQITKDSRKAYIGFRNVYMRYKKDYVKNPRARIDMLNRIIRGRTRIDAEVLLFWLERQWVQIRHRMPREANTAMQVEDSDLSGRNSNC